MARANQITQVVTGLNKTGAYSVNPITFPLTQVSIDACRVHIKKLRGETKYLIPALRKKDLRKLSIATDQLDSIERKLHR